MSIIIAPKVEFDPTAFCHQKLSDTAAIHANSAAYASNFLAQKAGSPGGHVGFSITQWTPPIFEVNSATPTVNIKPYPGKEFALTAILTAVPLPEDFAPSPDSDAEAVIYLPEKYSMWEFWGLAKTGAQVTNSAGQLVDEWSANWAGKITDMRHNPGYFSSGKGAQATGIAHLATLPTIKEQQTGIIKHAIQVQMKITSTSFVAPAQRSDGLSSDPNVAPMGSRFRFPAGTVFSGLSDWGLMFATAIRDYGLVITDTTGSGIAIRLENPIRYTACGKDPYLEAGGIFGSSVDAAWWPSSDGPPQLNWSLWPQRQFDFMPWDLLQVLA